MPLILETNPSWELGADGAEGRWEAAAPGGSGGAGAQGPSKGWFGAGEIPPTPPLHPSFPTVYVDTRGIFDGKCLETPENARFSPHVIIPPTQTKRLISDPGASPSKIPPRILRVFHHWRPNVSGLTHFQGLESGYPPTVTDISSYPCLRPHIPMPQDRSRMPLQPLKPSTGTWTPNSSNHPWSEATNCSGSHSHLSGLFDPIYSRGYSVLPSIEREALLSWCLCLVD